MLRTTFLYLNQFIYKVYLTLRWQPQLSYSFIHSHAANRTVKTLLISVTYEFPIIRKNTFVEKILAKVDTYIFHI